MHTVNNILFMILHNFISTSKNKEKKENISANMTHGPMYARVSYFVTLNS